MIFFQFFVQRWVAACQGLTAQSEGFYLRLCLWMYENEQPLPLDLGECFRIARVETRKDCPAVRAVLERFFVRTDGGYEQRKALAEIDRFQVGAPARSARRDLDTARKRRNREEQRRLYADAREKGLPVRAGMKLTELREMLGLPIHGANVVPLSRGVSAADMSRSPQEKCPVVPDAHETITHYVPKGTDSGQPADSPDREKRALAVLGEGGIDPVPKAPEVSDERLRSAVQALRTGGLIGINAGHPMLLELLRAGIRDDALMLAAAGAAAKGKGFAYALAVAEGQMRDAAAAALPSAKEREGANRVAQWAPGLEAKW